RQARQHCGAHLPGREPVLEVPAEGIPREPGLLARLPASEEPRAVMPLLKLGAVQVEYDQHGAGKPLLLLHSLLTEMTVFDRVLPRLSGLHRRTRLNLPGFGASSPVELAT